MKKTLALIICGLALVGCNKYSNSNHHKHKRMNDGNPERAMTHHTGNVSRNAANTSNAVTNAHHSGM